MLEFDSFINELFEEGKAFFEKGKQTEDESSKRAYFHASLLVAISALEACINSISGELLIDSYKEKYLLHEQALLLEKEVCFDRGEYILGERLKMARITDRIEFLYYKFTGKKLNGSILWYMQLKQSIDLRNKLVHPKEYVTITETTVERALLSVMETVNQLYLIIYKKKFPTYDWGLTARRELD